MAGLRVMGPIAMHFLYTSHSIWCHSLVVAQSVKIVRHIVIGGKMLRIMVHENGSQIIRSVRASVGNNS